MPAAETPPKTVAELDAALQAAELRAHTLEGALTTQQHRFEQVLEGSNLAFWELDIASDVLLCSPQWALQLGYPVQSLSVTGVALLEKVHEEDREAVQKKLRTAITGKLTSVELCFRMRHADRSWRWLLTRASLVRTTDGRCITVLGLQTDITVTKQLEAATQDTQLRYRSLYENAPLAFVIWDREGRITDWNKRAESLFGYARDQVMGRRFISLVFPNAEQDQMVDVARELIKNGGANHTETANIDAHGHSLHCNWHSVALKSARGTVSGVISLVQDDTQRWQAEETRRRDEMRNRALVETSPDAIFMLDTDGYIVTVNQQAVRLLSADDSSDLIGTHSALWIDDAQLDDYLAKVIATPEDRVGFIAHAEYPLVGFEGVGLLADMNYTTLGDALGEPAGIVLYVRDITEKRMQENELRQYRRHLETLVAERTAELTDARAAAEQAAKTKAEFLANMSHEIRTPMNAVLGLAHLALRTPLNPRQRDYIERIKGSGSMLLGLLNDVLDFSKIEAGRLSMESVPFVLDEVLDSVATLVGGRAREKHLEFHFLVAPEVPQDLIGDSLRLTQVLVNLCGNAVKFTEHGHVVVRIGVAAGEVFEDEQIALSFAIEDTGIGLTPEQAGRLFQAFTQADTSTTRKFGGTGLGLIISKRIVELMQGDISLNSTPGVGTTFYFNGRFGLAPAASHHAGQVPAALRGITVLVVDDHPLAREALSSSLRHLGMPVVVSEVCDVDRAVNVGLILADADQPCVLDKVREFKLRPGAPKVVLLANGDTEAIEARAAGSGIDDVIGKPFTLTRLLRLFAALCGEAQAGDAQSDMAPAHLAGQRVLLAEDIATNRMIAVEMLSDWGLNVDVAENGLEAVNKALAESANYALILMDIQMPELDGLEATRQIRAAGKRLPIIAMTAHTLSEERERCVAAGMDDFITKPVEPNNLLAALVRHIPVAHGDIKTGIALHSDSTGTGRGAVLREAPGAVASAGHLRPDGLPVLPAPTFGADIPSLPGIDTAAGLRRMMGKPVFYKRVLNDFLQRFDGVERVIGTALAEGRRDEAKRQAHSAKGLAGSIGATALSEAAARLEQSLAGTTDNASLLEAFQRELFIVIDGLRDTFQNKH
jgi:PAS domain S-box-containing protein